jgi:acyl carrier protein
MEFEKEFDISIPDDEAENIQTVGQAIEYLEANKK